MRYEGAKLGRFWFANTRELGPSLQLLPVVRQVASALPTDADQLPR